MHDSLALKDHDKCVRDVACGDKGDAKDDDVTNRLASIAHDLSCKQEHGDLDKSYSLSEHKLCRKRVLEQFRNSTWYNVPDVSSSSKFDICQGSHGDDTENPCLRMLGKTLESYRNGCLPKPAE